jgi:hypothetical protein
MAKLSIAPGSTDVTIYVILQDSASTTGGKKTGLAYDTASLTCYYTRTRGTSTAITLATLAAPDSAHSDGGFKEVSATNQPGLYRLDLPDAVCAASARSAVVTLKGATGMVQCDLEIDLASQVDTTRVGATTQTPGDLATLIAAIPAAVGVPVDAFPDTATRVVGTDQGGTVATVASEDGTYFSTGEVNSGNLLEVELSIASTDLTYEPGKAMFRAFYEGGAGHLVYGYRYDQLLAAYEATPITTMQTRTTPLLYEVPWSDDRFRDGSGGMKFKLVHSTPGTGITSHRLHIDMFKWEMAKSGAEQLAALAAIRAQTDRLQFNAPGNDVRASVLHNYVDGTLTLGEALTGIFARLCGKARGGGTATIEFLRHLSTRVALKFTANNKGDRSNVDEDLGA